MVAIRKQSPSMPPLENGDRNRTYAKIPDFYDEIRRYSQVFVRSRGSTHLTRKPYLVSVQKKDGRSQCAIALPFL